jgi:glycosyltransferase involved in cell wall biosynthesis
MRPDPVADPAVAPLRISLVVATLGRTRELDACLASLATQTHMPLEVIVVDQNADDRLAPVLARHAHTLPLRRLRALPGVSRARNVGLAAASGDVVAFPDDDCTYPPWLLQAVAAELARHPGLGGISICPRNEAGAPFPWFDRRPGPLTRQNVFSRTCMIGLFLRREVLADLEGFDERIGPGAGTPWGASEDIDLPIRALDRGHTIEYRPELSVTHTFDKPPDPRIAAALGRRYGGGLGFLMRRHGYPPTTAVHRLILRPLGGMAAGLVRGRWAEVRYYAATLRGRIAGWWRAPGPPG